MPRITLVNETQLPLHLSLRHISPLHYANGVRAGESAQLTCGRVWFTVEARIDRGDGNGYTKIDTFAAPVAVTLTALSLGAGAIYVVGAASAAGGMSAAVAAISARVGATAAAQAPTARRLYKYARKGQRVVQIGQVLGIGGGALAGKALAGKGEAAGEAPQGHTEVTSKVGDGSAKGLLGGLLDWDENKRVKEAKKTLKNLLEGSVVSSPGWYMSRDRTLRIRGGPRATELDGVLVIETDTVQPFEVVADEPEVKDGELASGGNEIGEDSHSAGEGLKKWLSFGRAGGKGKNKEAAAAAAADESSEAASQRPASLHSKVSADRVASPPLSPRSSDVSSPVSRTASPFPPGPDFHRAGAPPEVPEMRRNQSGESLYTRMRKARADRAEQMSALSASVSRTSIAGSSSAQAAAPAALAQPKKVQELRQSVSDDETPLSADERGAITASPMPPPDDDPHHPPSAEAVLTDMGFSAEQVSAALHAVGTPDALAAEAIGSSEAAELARVQREGTIEAAIRWLFENADQQVPYVKSETAKMGHLAPSSAGTSGAPSIATPFKNSPAASKQASPQASGRTSPVPAPPSEQKTVTPAAAGGSESAAASTSAAPLKVVGAESVTKPHWTERARHAADASGATKLVSMGSDLVMGHGHKWLAGDSKDAKAAAKKK